MMLRRCGERILKQPLVFLHDARSSICSNACAVRTTRPSHMVLKHNRQVLQHKSRLVATTSTSRILSTFTNPLSAKAVVNGPVENDPRKREIVNLTQELMTSIYEGDYETYVRLCDEEMTCFEPETAGNLIGGMPFHKYYFDNLLGKNKSGPLHTTITHPHVVMLGDDSAFICYIFLIQTLQGDKPVTIQREETRIWKKKDGMWKSLHFHKSIL